MAITCTYYGDFEALCNDIRARPSEWAQFVVNWVCEDTIPEGLRMLSGKDAQVFLDIFEEIAARTQPGRRRFLRKSRYTLRCWRHILCCLKLYSLKCRLMADAVDDEALARLLSLVPNCVRITENAIEHE